MFDKSLSCYARIHAYTHIRVTLPQAEKAAVARTSELATVRRTLEDALSVARREAGTSRKEVTKVRTCCFD
jgi:hypothetical protein